MLKEERMGMMQIAVGGYLKGVVVYVGLKV